MEFLTIFSEAEFDPIEVIQIYTLRTLIELSPALIHAVQFWWTPWEVAKFDCCPVRVVLCMLFARKYESSQLVWEVKNMWTGRLITLYFGLCRTSLLAPCHVRLSW